MSTTVGFIGLGLIGGSIARALKGDGLDVRTKAFDTDRRAVAAAFEEGVVDVMVSDVSSDFSDCDFVFLCAPVDVNMENAGKVGRSLRKDAILTDVGSIKCGMHSRIHDLGLYGVFIGGHPMAGSERIGFANSKAKLLENAYYVITLTPETSKIRLERYISLVKAMGAIPLVMTPEEHDYVTAAVSHVPHVISASLVNLVKDSDNREGDMRMIAAGGFKDITRISSSSPAMWRQICLNNSGNVSMLLDRYIESLEKIRDSIVSGDGDALTGFFDGARRYRESFIDASSGPIKTDNAVHVEIPDEPGALAVVVTMIAARGIDIKNVGIVHNREVESGSLRIELHDEKAVGEVCGLLSSKGYDVTSG